MHKIIATILLFLLIAILVIGICYTLTQQTPINNLKADSTAVQILFALAMSIIFAIIHRGAYSFGITLKYQSTDQALNIDTSTQSGLLICISPNELSNIDPDHNFFEFSINTTRDEFNPQIDITYNLGLSTETPKQGLNIGKIVPLTSEDSINRIKQQPDTSGLLITTKSNTLQQKLQGKQIISCIPSLHGYRMLSLLISYAKFDDIKDSFNSYTIKELHHILQSPAIDYKNKRFYTMQTVYDLTALDILQNVKELDPENHWVNTKEGQIAIGFFAMFSPQNIFPMTGKLSVSLTQELDNKLKYIMDYIQDLKYNEVRMYHGEYDHEILTKIRNTHFNTSYDINHYSHLWKNRLTSNSSNILSILKSELDRDIEFQYICTLAAIDSHDTDTSAKKTNKVIKKMLPQNEVSGNIKLIIKNADHITGLIDPNNLHFNNHHITAILQKLSKNEHLTFQELIRRARNYVANFCKVYMVPYIERDENKLFRSR